MLEDVSEGTLRRHLKGERLVGTRRHGKHLFIEVSEGGWLRLHFGITGAVKYYTDASDALDHQRLVLDFQSGGHLGYGNMGKLGQIGWTGDPDDVIAENGLGPDPLAPAFNLERIEDGWRVAAARSREH